MHQTGSVRKSEIDLNASPDENEHKSNHWLLLNFVTMTSIRYQKSQKSYAQSINRNINGHPSNSKRS